jgi:tetratricopeptide (TPR) repeat protein
LNFKAWQILCFIAVIIGATVVVFPTQRRMLPFLFDSGRYKQARSVLTPLLENYASDEQLVWQSVRLYLLEGSPYEAIDQLERFNRLSPLRSDQWVELAKLYEWTRNPPAARSAWEAALAKMPDDETIMARLIGFYRYAGETEKEAGLIVRRIRQQRSAQAEKGTDTLAELIADELEMNGRDMRASPLDPLEAMLVSGLYQIYLQRIDMDPASGPPDARQTTELILRCFEQYAWAGYPQRGEAFAQQLDRLWSTGISRQLQLADVLRWSDMNREALELLTRIHTRIPASREVLMEMAAAAVAAEDPIAAIHAYETVDRMDPLDPLHRQHLMALYLQTGRTQMVLDNYWREFEKTRDMAVLFRLLDLAVAAGDDRMKETASQLAATVDVPDADLLARRAELYLALNRPADAYPLMKRQAMVSGDSGDPLAALIRVAGYTDDPSLMADALETAETRLPDDADLLLQVVDGWLAAGRPEKAYASMRRLTELRGNRTDDIDRTLTMAEHTGDARFIQAAVEWAVELAPEDPDVADRAIDLYLAVGRADRAYRLKADVLKRQRRVNHLPALIRLAESTGRPDLMEDALRTGLALLPDDAGLQRDLARFYVSQGEETLAIATYETYLKRQPGDMAAMVQLAELYEWQHQPRNALGIYRQLAESYPGDANFSAAVVRLTGSAGDREEMLNLLMAQSDAHPEDASRAVAAGRELVAENRLEQSLVYLERAAKLDPDQTATWQMLADVYAWTGRSDALIRSLENLAKNGALDQPQRIQLADAYLNRQRAGDVLPLLNDIEALPALPVKEGLMLLEAYERTHRQAAAMRIYRRLMDENQANAAFLSELGDRALWRERTGLALKAYAAALKRDPTNRNALKGSGQIHAWNNNHQRAIDLLEAYNRNYPLDYEAHYLLGELYFATHRQGAANRQYRKAMKLINLTKRQRQPAGTSSQSVQVRQ